MLFSKISMTALPDMSFNYVMKTACTQTITILYIYIYIYFYHYHCHHCSFCDTKSIRFQTSFSRLNTAVKAYSIHSLDLKLKNIIKAHYHMLSLLDQSLFSASVLYYSKLQQKPVFYDGLISTTYSS